MRSIAGRSDFSEGEDDEGEGEAETAEQTTVDDSYVLDYVSQQLQRVKSFDTNFDPNERENEFEAKADGGPIGTWRTINGFQ